MSKKTLTQWFPADVKPVHVGVYEVKLAGGKCYAYFDGNKFCFRLCGGAKKAYEFRNFETTLIHYAEWRGLAVKP